MALSLQALRHGAFGLGAPWQREITPRWLQPVPNTPRPRSRHPALRLLASRQMAVAVPQPQPPQPEPQAGAPKWALGAGLLAVAAAAFKLAWSFRRPLPVAAPPAAAAGAASLGAAAAPAAPVAPPPAPTEEKVALPSAAADAPRGAVKEAAEPAVSVNGAPADVASVGPVLLAAEAAGVVDETPTMSLEELRSTATELYMLIQQVRPVAGASLEQRRMF